MKRRKQLASSGSQFITTRDKIRIGAIVAGEAKEIKNLIESVEGIGKLNITRGVIFNSRHQDFLYDNTLLESYNRLVLNPNLYPHFQTFLNSKYNFTLLDVMNFDVVLARRDFPVRLDQRHIDAMVEMVLNPQFLKSFQEYGDLRGPIFTPERLETFRRIQKAGFRLTSEPFHEKAKKRSCLIL